MTTREDRPELPPPPAHAALPPVRFSGGLGGGAVAQAAAKHANRNLKEDKPVVGAGNNPGQDIWGDTVPTRAPAPTSVQPPSSLSSTPPVVATTQKPSQSLEEFASSVMESTPASITTLGELAAAVEAEDVDVTDDLDETVPFQLPPTTNKKHTGPGLAAAVLGKMK